MAEHEPFRCDLCRRDKPRLEELGRRLAFYAPAGMDLCGPCTLEFRQTLNSRRRRQEDVDDGSSGED